MLRHGAMYLFLLVVAGTIGSIICPLPNGADVVVLLVCGAYAAGAMIQHSLDVPGRRRQNENTTNVTVTQRG